MRPATEDSLSIAVVPPSTYGNDASQRFGSEATRFASEASRFANDASRLSGTTRDSDFNEYITEERLPSQPKTFTTGLSNDVTTEHSSIAPTATGFVAGILFGYIYILINITIVSPYKINSPRWKD